MTGLDVNALIREASGRIPVDQAEPVEQPIVGDVGIGVGGAARAPRVDASEAINAQLRIAFQAHRHLALGDLLNL